MSAPTAPARAKRTRRGVAKPKPAATPEGKPSEGSPPSPAPSESATAPEAAAEPTATCTPCLLRTNVILKRLKECDSSTNGLIKCRKTFIDAFERKVAADLMRSVERAVMSGRKTLLPADV